MKKAAPQHADNRELIRRYPGPRSFNDEGIDEHLFFGRDAEIAALSNRIQARRTLVLFGRSGLGKTSLIQAGLFPALRKLGYLPISIRLNNPKIDVLLEEMLKARVDAEKTRLKAKIEKQKAELKRQLEAEKKALTESKKRELKKKLEVEEARAKKKLEDKLKKLFD